MPSSGATLIEIITAIGVFVTPILLIVFSGIGWAVKRRIEAAAEARRRDQDIEEQIRDARIQVYNEVLEPYILFLSPKQSPPANRGRRATPKSIDPLVTITSVEYRQSLFKFTLFANDDIMRAHNALRKCGAPVGDSEKRALLRAFGTLLLEIRKGVGNESTSLTYSEMLEWMITDIDSDRLVEERAP